MTTPPQDVSTALLIVGIASLCLILSLTWLIYRARRKTDFVDINLKLLEVFIISLIAILSISSAASNIATQSTEAASTSRTQRFQEARYPALRDLIAASRSQLADLQGLRGFTANKGRLPPTSTYRELLIQFSDDYESVATACAAIRLLTAEGELFDNAGSVQNNSFLMYQYSLYILNHPKERRSPDLIDPHGTKVDNFDYVSYQQRQYGLIKQIVDEGKKSLAELQTSN